MQYIEGQTLAAVIQELRLGERGYRAFTISEQIDWQKISAELKNGVLAVHLPKAETVKPRKITVKGE